MNVTHLTEVFDKIERQQTDDETLTRVRTPTRSAATSLISALKDNISLQQVAVNGLGYELFEEVS